MPLSKAGAVALFTDSNTVCKQTLKWENFGLNKKN